jgi:integrase
VQRNPLFTIEAIPLARVAPPQPLALEAPRSTQSTAARHQNEITALQPDQGALQTQGENRPEPMADGSQQNDRQRPHEAVPDGPQPIKPYRKLKGTPPEFVTLVNQLAEVTALNVPPLPQIEEEILTLQEIRSRWFHRSDAFKLRWKQEWQDLQARYLFLLAYPPSERDTIFYQLVSYFDWSYKTAQKHYGAFIAGTAVVDCKVTSAMRAQAKVLQFLAAEETQRKETSPLLEEELELAAARLPTATACALRVAFHLGQRMGDVLNLTAPCTKRIVDPTSGMTFLSILFRQGKTTRVLQPFALHLPETMPAAQALRELDQARSGRPLFVEEGEDEKRKMLDTISKCLQTVNPLLRCLSIRRGGLQAMALGGIPTHVLLHHSRHASMKNLERYLGWGELLLDPARERWSIQKTQAFTFQRNAEEGIIKVADIYKDLEAGLDA